MTEFSPNRGERWNHEERVIPSRTSSPGKANGLAGEENSLAAGQETKHDQDAADYQQAGESQEVDDRGEDCGPTRDPAGLDANVEHAGAQGEQQAEAPVDDSAGHSGMVAAHFLEPLAAGLIR